MSFWVSAMVLLALAGAFIMRPFLARGRAANAKGRAGENVRIYRERAAELEAERANGAVSEEDARQLEAELKDSLLRDADDLEHEDASADAGRWLGYVVLALVVVTSVVFYIGRGNIDGISLATAFEQLEAQSRDDPQRMIEAKSLTGELVSRVHDQPENAEMWYLLGRTALFAADHRLSAGAFRQVLALGNEELVVRIYLVQALYLANASQVTPEVRVEIDAVLSRHQDEPIMVEILASDAFRRGDYGTATDWLERGLRQPLGPEREVYFRRALELARAGAGDQAAPAPSPGFEVEVDIAPGIRESLPPSTVVFILARAPGERMPLAVERRQLAELPVKVVLNDATAMNPARRLSTVAAVEIVARTAIGGSATRSDNDLEAVAGPFQMESGVTPVSIVLGGPALDVARGDSVENANERAGIEAVPAPSPGFEVEVDIAPEIRESFPPSTLVFILARAPGERMPLAVARRQLAELPVKVVLDDSTAMNPARRLSTASAVEIVARTSTGGTATRSDDDLEAVAGPFELESGVTPVSLLLSERAL